MKPAHVFSVILGLALISLSIPQAFAQSYRARDAEFVTSSKNIDVLSYVVCLKEESDKMPRSMSLSEALDNAVRECRNDAVRMPSGRNDPTADDIRLAILECGFQPGDASPNSDCGTQGSKATADAIEASPTLINAGKWLEGIVYDGKDIWAAESGQRTTAQIDFNSGNVVKRHKVGRLPIEVVTDGNGNTYTLVATDQKILVHDRRGRTTTLADLADYPEAMDQDNDALWVLVSPGGSSDNSVVVRVDTRSGKQEKTRNLGEWATDILSFQDEVWVSHAQRNEITVVTKDRLRDTVVRLLNADIWKLTTDSNFIYGAGRPDDSTQQGLVVKINPLTREESGRVALPEMIMEVAADGTFIFAIGESGKIWIITADDMQIQRLVESKTAGAKFAPSAAMVIEDFLVVAARQFYDAAGNPIKDSRRKDDENGAILVYGNILPDGSWVMTAPATAQGNSARPSPRPTTNNVRPTRPSRPQTATNNTRPSRPSGVRPSRPGSNASNGRPSRPASFGGRKSGLPQRPTRAGGSRSGFPTTAGSLGGNVRQAPDVNAKKIGGTGRGQPVTLLENVGRTYKGYPWFKIKMANGRIGYQWGGGTCALPRKPVQGTKGKCKRTQTASRPGSGNRPTSGGNSSSPTNSADVVIKALDVFGKLLDNANRPNRPGNANRPNRGNNGNTNRPNRPSSGNFGNNLVGNPNVFTQVLRVPPNGQGVIASRSVAQGKAVVYSVKARRGQTLDVNIWSPRNNAVFEIYVGQAYKGGPTLPGAAANQNTQDFNGVLPVDTNYKIAVGSVDGTADYQMVVSLDPATKTTVTNSGKNPNKGTKTNSGGSVAENKFAVGTYSSTTGATSGNIELNEKTNTLTWTEFCGPTNVLTADWSFGQLKSNIGTIELDISNVGEVTGFSLNGHFYTKGQGIIMPGCVAGPSAASLAPDWVSNPKDPRAKKDYSAVPNAYWQICETANYDENSPDYNNETAYWNCADDGVAMVAASNDDDNTFVAYEHVQPAEQKKCLAKSNDRKNPTNDPNYKSCMDQAEMNALEELEDAGAADEDAAAALAAKSDPVLNPRGAYTALSGDVLIICQGEISCLDAAVSQASRADAQGIANRLAADYSDLTDTDIDQCNNVAYGSDEFFTCLENVRANKLDANAGKEPGWDRADVFYQPAYDHCIGTLGLTDGSDEYSDCYFEYPNYKPAADTGTADNDNGTVDPNAGKEPGWDRADVFYQPAYDHCVGTLGLADGSGEYSDCYFAYPNYQPTVSTQSEDSGEGYTEPEQYDEPVYQEGNADTGKEPGWDRADVFYQPAYDHCVGTLGLAEGTDEYSNCYFAYPNY